MLFEPTEEQAMLVATVRDFMHRECPREYVRECDEAHRFPEEAWTAAARAGLTGIAVPEEYGGQRGTVVDAALALEEMARHSTALSMAITMATSFGVHSVGEYGSEAQKATILPGIASGEVRFALGLTEPDAGFDTLATKTRAARDGAGWRITGQKIFTTLAHLAEYVVVLARTSTGERRGDGLSIFLIPQGTAGMEVQPIKKLGNWQIGTNTVFLDGAHVGEEALLGDEGRGWELVLHTLNNERILTAAVFLGTARAALDDAVAYAKERAVFGRPIGTYQAIQHPLAELATDLELVRLMMLKAAALQSAGRSCGVEATMAQWRAAELAFDAADRGMQVLGGHGYTFDHDMQRYWRDARVWRHGPISPEMAKNFVAQSLGLPKSYGF
jgi:acyl-CoA dehydrogenase